MNTAWFVKSAAAGTLATLLLVQQAAAFKRSGTSAAMFLKLATDARSAAMAGATAALESAQSAWWSGAGNLLVNPASVAGAASTGLCFSRQELYADLEHNALAGVLPFREHLSLSGAATWLSAPDQEITTLEEPEGTGMYYSYGDFSLNLGAALRLSDRLAFGALGRYIRQELHNEVAEGLALDLGILLRTAYRGIRLGIVMANFGRRLRLEGEDLLIPSEDGRPSYLETHEFQLPLTFRAGVAGELLEAEGQRVTAALQAEHPNDNVENLRLGFEYALRERFFLRGGRCFRRDLETWTAGFGLRAPFPGSTAEILLDYAWTDYSELGDVHLFSLGFRY